MKLAPAVFLAILLLSGCKDRAQDDFTLAWGSFQPSHVSGSE
jgi:hypothetical protein